MWMHKVQWSKVWCRSGRIILTGTPLDSDLELGIDLVLLLQSLLSLLQPGLQLACARIMGWHSFCAGLPPAKQH